LTGMEKHSDFRRDDLYQNGHAFFDIMRENMCRLPTPSLQCAMNELSNHDHSRFLTRTNGRVGRLQSAGSGAASEGIQIPVFQEAVVIQMTWPGAPTIYYGDEAGQVGWTDPDNRRTYPWNHENQNLIKLHQALTRLRGKLPVLKNGSVKPLCGGHGYIAYARFDEEATVIVACNNLDHAQLLTLPLRDVGIPDGIAIHRVFHTTGQGFLETDEQIGHVSDGQFQVSLEARSASIILPRKP
ncbi:MAG: alpha-glycosidase, partial [Clostridia bacterium]|nr:alpha-glycosidase [Clostridia bacterium]